VPPYSCVEFFLHERMDIRCSTVAEALMDCSAAGECSEDNEKFEVDLAMEIGGIHR